MRLVAAWCGVVLAASPLQAQQGILLARGHWAALHGPGAGQCRAVSRSLRKALPNDDQARASFTFDAKGNRRGQFHVRLSRAIRPGSTVMLSIGATPFLLLARGRDGWSSGPAQEQAIIAEARRASAMRVEARDAHGRRFVDHYLLDGAPSAIDSAAARCAPKLVKPPDRA